MVNYYLLLFYSPTVKFFYLFPSLILSSLTIRTIYAVTFPLSSFAACSLIIAFSLSVTFIVTCVVIFCSSFSILQNYIFFIASRQNTKIFFYSIPVSLSTYINPKTHRKPLRLLSKIFLTFSNTRKHSALTMSIHLLYIFFLYIKR